MSSTTEFYCFTAYISPDFMSPGEEKMKAFRKYLSANEMRDLEMAYNTTKTNSVEVIYRHPTEPGDRSTPESKILGVVYALDHIPKVGLNAYIVMRNNKRDELSRSMHAKIKSGTMTEVSIGMKIRYGTDRVTKDLIIVDHVALLDIPSFFAYAQKTTGAGSFIRETENPTFPPGKTYSMDIIKQRLGDFLNSKKTVGDFYLKRAFTPQSTKHPLAVKRDFMSDADKTPQTQPGDSGKEDSMDTSSVDPAKPGETGGASENRTVAERIASIEKEIKDTNDSIEDLQKKVTALKADGSAESKAGQQSLLASIESLNTCKSKLEASLDQLAKSEGLEAATVEHIIKTSKEASLDTKSTSDAVAEILKEIMEDLSEDDKRKIDRLVAKNQDTKDAMTTVMASFVNRKRKAADAPEDAPSSKRPKLDEVVNELKGLKKQVEELNRGFAAAASSKTSPIAEILQQANDHVERAKKRVADAERVNRGFGGSTSGPSKQTAPANKKAPVHTPPKHRGRELSEDEVEAQIASANRVSKLLSQTTNSSMSH